MTTTGEVVTDGSKDFYRESLSLLTKSNIPFLIGGGFAFRHYTNIHRDTKDLDIFCKASYAFQILKFLSQHGFKTEITDARWIAKAYKGDFYIDIIFNTVNNICPVNDRWYEHSHQGDLLGSTVSFISPEDLIWCKIYVQSRDRYDAADINHIILLRGKEIKWEQLKRHMDQHWHLLLAQFLNYQFVYPSERDNIPKWLFDELLKRASEQYDLPASFDKVCLGPIIDQYQYDVDILEGKFKVITSKTI
jgi:hypothetical protein